MNLSQAMGAALMLILSFLSRSVPAMCDDHDTPAIRRTHPFDIQLKNNDDRTTITSHRVPKPEADARPADTEETWLIEITSPGGIGRAVVKRCDPHWPSSIRLRWKLKALESLRCEITDTCYEGFVDNRSLSTHWSRRTGKGETSQLKPDSTLWSEIRVTGTLEGHRASIPLEAAQAFEFKIPEAWLTNNPDSLAFEWVDFHR